jgi:ATP/ADP translocase
MKHLKIVAILLAPFALMYLLFGFVFWNWDAQSWSEGARIVYVGMALSLVMPACAWLGEIK